MKPYLLVLHNKIRFAFRHIKCKGIKAKGILLISRNTKIVATKNSELILGSHIVNDGRFVIMVQDGKVNIGDNVYFNEDVMISCKSYVEIGEGCRFGPNVKIFDNNHKFDVKNGVKSDFKAATITIGKNCWIGTNVVILKGTTIGDNCVIGAGCVVSGDIPKGSIVTQSRDLKIEPIRE